MTVPSERTRAVVETRHFLEKLAYGNMSNQPPERLKEYAEALLRHYPYNVDLHLASVYLPMFWASPSEGEKR